MHQTLSAPADSNHSQPTAAADLDRARKLSRKEQARARWLAESDGLGLDFETWWQRDLERQLEAARANGVADARALAVRYVQDSNVEPRLRTLMINVIELQVRGRDAEANALIQRFRHRLYVRPRRRNQPTTRCRRTRTTRSTRRTTTRTHRVATKKTAATSTGDPDPEPSSDARARLRSVALIETATVGGGL
jgi:hypothetical protein